MDIDPVHRSVCGYEFNSRKMINRQPKRAAEPAHAPAAYQCAMHPWITSDHPGKCTICGMDLVPVVHGPDNGPADPNLVTLTSNQVAVSGVQTAAVTRGPLEIWFPIESPTGVI